MGACLLCRITGFSGARTLPYISLPALQLSIQTLTEIILTDYVSLCLILLRFTVEQVARVWNFPTHNQAQPFGSDSTHQSKNFPPGEQLALLI